MLDQPINSAAKGGIVKSIFRAYAELMLKNPSDCGAASITTAEDKTARYPLF